MRRFVIGDIHGAHRALKQCFERAGFDKHSDVLICLGDLCDGWPDVHQVFDELLGIRNLILILGNHDRWLLDWFKTGYAPDIWLMQGGDITLKSIHNRHTATYHKMIGEAKLYYIVDNMLFVHGGILTDIPLEQQAEDVFLWDRSLIRSALLNLQHGKETRLTSFDKIFVGHTPTIKYTGIKPIDSCGVCMLDTGAGWPGGVLSMLDIDNKTLYQSEPVDQLYPECRGRI
jgi:serine/threonine protein phosphatase 1